MPKNFKVGDVRKITSDPHQSFHRCTFCGEYPHLAGEFAIVMAHDKSGFKWGYCAKCVDKMHAALHGTEVTDVDDL